MSIQVSPNLPINVVEIGNEITQAKVDEINSGTLALQTWVSASYLTTSSASTTYAPKASPTFTGTVTIPAGASISGYLTSATASSTYQPLSGMTSYLTTATASTTYQTQAGMSSYLTTSSASTTYATKASPTFTGTVTIPSGASISGYLTTSSASSTYQTQAGMSSYLTTSSASSTYQTQAGMSSYLTDAPNNGSEYVRKNATWAVATGGGGGGGVWGSITGTLTAQTDLTSYVTGLGYQTAGDVSTYVTGLGYITSAGLSVTNIDLTGNFNGYNAGSGNYTFKWTQSTNTLRLQDGAGSGISISDTAITFPNSSTLTKAPFPRGQVIGTVITLAAGDENKLICITGSANAITVPPDSSVNFAVGTEFVIVTETLATNYVNQGSMGTPTINGSGMSAYYIPRYVTRLVKVAADTWYID